MFTADCLSLNQAGHLTIDGHDTVALAERYGTPLYVMSETQIRNTCRSYVASFARYYRGLGCPIYASKAFSCKAICKIVAEEGFDLDVVSMGEIHTALLAGVKADRLHFHGNNKSAIELSYAIDAGIGEIVADNLREIEMIDHISQEKNVITRISLRIKPGIEAHTHAFIRTGQIDSKFGLAIETGEAMDAVNLGLSCKNVNLTGLHCHIGSQVVEVAPFVAAAQVMLAFYAEIKRCTGKSFTHLNLGGGFGAKYLQTDDFIPYEAYMEAVSAAVRDTCKVLSLDIPIIYIEPGRSIVAESGITLYTVGTIKEIPNVRNYVAVDGGMGDNPRYALYQAPYTAVIANKASAPADYPATIAGRYCESGDLIQEHTALQKPIEGDILAVLSTGAYNYSMASNYNRTPRPGCLMVTPEEAHWVVLPETLEDLVRNDI